MTKEKTTDASGTHGSYTGLSTSGVTLMASVSGAEDTCAADPVPDFDRPGYTLCHWVDRFTDTAAGQVPVIRTRLSMRDRVATARVRCGISRHQYRIAPGLYAVGEPDGRAEVLVTANFKLTFDYLRKELDGISAWILVLDTKGVNVWCAAGKGTFSTEELVSRIRSCRLDSVVDHRRLILPQLGATGVSAKRVTSASGFRVIYGPVRAADIPGFLENGRKADPEMRRVTFSLRERIVLTPVELKIALKPALITALFIFLVSGIGPGVFSLGAAWTRGWTALAALGAGMVSGAVITPALLPHIPVREFALKGMITGTLSAALLLTVLPAAGLAPNAGLFLLTLTVSSFLAMNFTGTTPFTSPSGVEKEMKRYIPVQMACLVLSLGSWIYGAFA